jgi:hypothetical protein
VPPQTVDAFGVGATTIGDGSGSVNWTDVAGTMLLFRK